MYVFECNCGKLILRRVLLEYFHNVSFYKMPLVHSLLFKQRTHTHTHSHSHSHSKLCYHDASQRDTSNNVGRQQE